MKVHFVVYESTEAAIVEEAHKILNGFSESKRWNIEYVAEIDVRNNQGDIHMWRCEVTATHEELE